MTRDEGMALLKAHRTELDQFGVGALAVFGSVARGNAGAEILQTAAAHGACNIRVFGSTARGEAQAGSDLDLLITLDPGRGLLDLVAIKHELEDLLGCSVHVVADASPSPYLRDQVLRDVVGLRRTTAFSRSVSRMPSRRSRRTPVPQVSQGRLVAVVHASMRP